MGVLWTSYAPHYKFTKGVDFFCLIIDVIKSAVSNSLPKLKDWEKHNGQENGKS